MIEKYYYENVIDEILEIMKTNLLLYYRNSNDTFPYLKEFCSDKEDSKIKYKNLSYSKLLFFTEEALAELLNCDYLYDFRALE